MEALKLGWQDAVDHFNSVAQDMLQTGAEFAKSLKTALSGTFSALVHGDFGKIKNAWESMLDAMTDALAAVIANQWVKLISQFMQYAMSSFGSIFGGSVSSGGYSYAMDTRGFSVTGLAKGGITPGALIPMMQQPARLAMGGVMTRPTLAWVAEAGQREAVVPLPDGHSIPVEMRAPGGVGQAPGVTVNLIGQGAERAEVRTSQSDIEGMVVDIILGNINRRGALSQLVR